MSQDVNVVALVKGEERYIFLFADSQKGETLRTLGRYASNPELSFSWYDAAVLSQKVRRAVRKKQAKNSQWANQAEPPVHRNDVAEEKPNDSFGGVSFDSSSFDSSSFDSGDFDSGDFDDEDYREFEDFTGEGPIW